MRRTANQSSAAIIDNRRRAVARLRLRGLTVREIEAQLPHETPPVVNQKDGKAWAIGTIQNDLNALRDEWQQAAQKDISALKAAILAEIREARRAAWESGRIDFVLKALEDERKLFGLDAPAKAELSGAGGGPIIALLPAVRTDETLETE